MSGEKPAPCRVDGAFVQPCETLRGALDGQRVNHLTLANMATFEPTRSMVVLKAGEYRKRGIVMAFCPFCGVDISRHLDDAVEDGNRLSGVVS